MINIKLPMQVKEIFSKTDKVKMRKLRELKIDAEFKALYVQEEDKVHNIAENMKANGFDKSQPIIILSDGTIVDGHSRFMAATEAGLTEVAVVVKEFESRNEVLLYMEHLQLDRRNLTEAEKLIHFEKLQRFKAQAKAKGEDVSLYSDEEIAKKLDVSPRQVQKMKEVEKKATPEQLEAIRNGETTLNQVHKEIKKEAAPEKTTEVTELVQSEPKKKSTEKKLSGAKKEKFVLNLLSKEYDDKFFYLLKSYQAFLENLSAEFESQMTEEMRVSLNKLSDGVFSKEVYSQLWGNLLKTICKLDKDGLLNPVEA